MADKKLQIAIYWGAACGGCDVSVLDTNEFILDVAASPTSACGPSPPTASTRTSRPWRTASSTSPSSTARCATPRTSTSPSCCARRARSWSPSAPAPTWAASPGWPTSRSRDKIFDTRLPAQPLHRAGQPHGAAARDVRSTATMLEHPRVLPAGLQARPRRRRRLLPPRLSAAARPGARRRPPGRRQGASCRPRARWSGPSSTPCARTARAPRTRRRSSASTGRGRSWPTRTPACWSRASSAPAWPPARAAACAAPRAASPAAAATGRRPAWSTRAPSWPAPSPRSSTARTRKRSSTILDGLPDFTSFAYRYGVAVVAAAKEPPAMTRKITIDPITRLEGHGKIAIFLDDAGAVEDCYFQIPELRGFEQFVVGRPIEELPRIVTRICGVCPASHHMASAKAVDGCFGDEVAPLAHKLRDMYYNAHYIHSHTAHFYALAAPDFVLGPDADPAMRNILGRGGQGRPGDRRRRSSASRGLAQEIQRIIGGRNTQDIWCLPGGVAKRLKPEELEQIKPWVDELYDFTQFTPAAVPRRRARPTRLRRPHRQRSLHARRAQHGPGGREQRPQLLRRQDARGRLRGQGDLQVRGQATTPTTWPSTWSPGRTSSSPTSRSAAGRASSRASTRASTAPRRWPGSTWPTAWPRRKAQEAFEEMFATLGGHPCRALLAQHWARLVEMVQNAETLQALLRRPGDHRRRRCA